MFLTSAWSDTPTVVNAERLTRFSQCWLMADRDGSVTKLSINDPFQLNWSIRACAMECAYKCRL